MPPSSSGEDGTRPRAETSFLLAKKPCTGPAAAAVDQPSGRVHPWKGDRRMSSAATARL